MAAAVSSICAQRPECPREIRIPPERAQAPATSRPMTVRVTRPGLRRSRRRPDSEVATAYVPLAASQGVRPTTSQSAWPWCEPDDERLTRRSRARVSASAGGIAGVTVVAAGTCADGPPSNQSEHDGVVAGDAGSAHCRIRTSLRSRGGVWLAAARSSACGSEQEVAQQRGVTVPVTTRRRDQQDRQHDHDEPPAQRRRRRAAQAVQTAPRRAVRACLRRRARRAAVTRRAGCGRARRRPGTGHAARAGGAARSRRRAWCG